MASSIKSLPPLPQPTEPLVDPRTGFVNTSWFIWFKRVDDHIRDIEKRLDENDVNYATLDARVTDLET